MQCIIIVAEADEADEDPVAGAGFSVFSVEEEVVLPVYIKTVVG